MKKFVLITLAVLGFATVAAEAMAQAGRTCTSTCSGPPGHRTCTRTCY